VIKEVRGSLVQKSIFYWISPGWVWRGVGVGEGRGLMKGSQQMVILQYNCTMSVHCTA
jgi:hypothetical protein